MDPYHIFIWTVFCLGMGLIGVKHGCQDIPFSVYLSLLGTVAVIVTLGYVFIPAGSFVLSIWTKAGGLMLLGLVAGRLLRVSISR